MLLLVEKELLLFLILVEVMSVFQVVAVVVQLPLLLPMVTMLVFVLSVMEILTLPVALCVLTAKVQEQARVRAQKTPSLSVLHSAALRCRG